MSSTEHAIATAHAAWRTTRHSSQSERAVWLRAIADALESEVDSLVALAHRETHLPDGRLRGELTRTCFQARLFARRLEAGTLFPVAIDPADAEWPMGPRPDIRRGHVPIGPVLVFAASNFPFAFSVAGGDTASALAAGCPVVVKIHPGHVELSRAVAEIAARALGEHGAPAGMLTTVEGLQAGTTAVVDPRIKAVGFTGSVHGGRALFDLACGRPDPIPFYGELGSTNPVVVTTNGWAERAEEIVAGFTGSFTLGSGQFCTQPGVILVPDAQAFADRLDLPAVDPMLNESIRAGFDHALGRLTDRAGVQTAATGPQSSDAPAAQVLTAAASAVLDDPSIVREEVFGPVAVLVEYSDADQARAVLDLFDGALTASVHGSDTPDEDAFAFLEQCVTFAGRVLWNQWPTGVTVSDAQQHGGPWPATTAPTTTSVGTAAALRFARPVAYQNLPAAALPAELRS